MVTQELKPSTLVSSRNNQPVTTSRLVSKVFHKKHNHVMRNIRTLIKSTDQKWTVEKMYAKGTYKNKQNHRQPMYYMNLDGFNLLVMGFTGKEALHYKVEFIHAFDDMKAKLDQQNYLALPKNYSKALRQLADAYDRNQKLLPKAKSYDKWDSNKGLTPISQIAKSYFGRYHMSGRRLNTLLNNYGVQYKRGKTWYLYKKYDGKGLANYYKIPINHNKIKTSNLEWYEKGIRFICKIMTKHGYKPSYRNDNN